jgi:hypothetical protein
VELKELSDSYAKTEITAEITSETFSPADPDDQAVRDPDDTA